MLSAPAHWPVIDFISDLHLQAALPRTVEAFAHWLAHTPAQAAFILGDLFEVWVGDDAADEAGFEQDMGRLLHAASQRLALFFLAGNRDFLLGEGFAQRAGLRLLSDPTRLLAQGQRLLLTHGDALCLDDTDYMAFRAQVRTPAWQQRFLAQPLGQRRDIAAGMRARSEQLREQRTQPQDWADVDHPAASDWLRSCDATLMIHGHTHKPARHALGEGLAREVLSDWDLDHGQPRGQILRLQDGRLQRLALH